MSIYHRNTFRNEKINTLKVTYCFLFFFGMVSELTGLSQQINPSQKNQKQSDQTFHDKTMMNSNKITNPLTKTVINSDAITNLCWNFWKPKISKIINVIFLKSLSSCETCSKFWNCCRV